ncbi:hypothetical protein TRVL_05511 [Trypanosoma vivax]|nr:hypothetical protein TRVL_05511 [Trypanosoma vivax]
MCAAFSRSSAPRTALASTARPISVSRNAFWLGVLSSSFLASREVGELVVSPSSERALLPHWRSVLAHLRCACGSPTGCALREPKALSFFCALWRANALATTHLSRQRCCTAQSTVRLARLLGKPPGALGAWPATGDPPVGTRSRRVGTLAASAKAFGTGPRVAQHGQGHARTWRMPHEARGVRKVRRAERG